MKKLKKGLKWLIYHQTNEITYEESHPCFIGYTEYRLFRIDRILGFKHRVMIDSCNSLGKGIEKRNKWVLNYNNIKGFKI